MKSNNSIYNDFTKIFKTSTARKGVEKKRKKNDQKQKREEKFATLENKKKK